MLDVNLPRHYPKPPAELAIGASGKTRNHSVPSTADLVEHVLAPGMEQIVLEFGVESFDLVRKQAAVGDAEGGVGELKVVVERTPHCVGTYVEAFVADAAYYLGLEDVEAAAVSWR